MHLTGYDTVILTCENPAKVLHSALSDLSHYWPSLRVTFSEPKLLLHRDGEVPALKSWPKRRCSMYVVRGKEMDSFLERKGYDVDRRGEGPVGFYYRIMRGVLYSIEAVKEVMPEPVVGMLPDPYGAWLCSRRMWEVRITTPGDPDRNTFSKRICDRVRNECCGL